MHKSNKRIKLEKEIFSKSIKDIERMFNLESPYEKLGCGYTVPTSQKFSRLDLPAGTGLQQTQFHYDCVNLSLMLSDTQSSYGEHEIMKPPVLPSSTLMRGTFLMSMDSLPRTVLLDLQDDEDVDDYKFELDLKLYMPRLNLEKDLNMIDQMLTVTSNT